jgi:hypothetical protein
MRANRIYLQYIDLLRTVQLSACISAKKVSTRRPEIIKCTYSKSSRFKYSTMPMGPSRSRYTSANPTSATTDEDRWNQGYPIVHGRDMPPALRIWSFKSCHDAELGRLNTFTRNSDLQPVHALLTVWRKRNEDCRARTGAGDLDCLLPRAHPANIEWNKVSTTSSTQRKHLTRDSSTRSAFPANSKPFLLRTASWPSRGSSNCIEITIKHPMP